MVAPVLGGGLLSVMANPRSGEMIGLLIMIADLNALSTTHIDEVLPPRVSQPQHRPGQRHHLVVRRHPRRTKKPLQLTPVRRWISQRGVDPVDPVDPPVGEPAADRVPRRGVSM